MKKKGSANRSLSMYGGQYLGTAFIEVLGYANGRKFGEDLGDWERRGELGTDQGRSKIPIFSDRERD
jgi:hypothetical protein